MGTCDPLKYCPYSINVPNLGTVCLSSQYTYDTLSKDMNNVGATYENGDFYITYNGAKKHVVNKGTGGEYFCFTGSGGCSTVSYSGEFSCYSS
jgi:hypothetical protein